MSSNIEIQKYCELCGASFTAKTTVTRFCSDVCSKRAYKARKRAEKLNLAIAEVKPKKSKSVIDVREKEFLTVTEVSKLIGCSRQNVYKLINTGKLKATNILIKKTIILRKDIDKLFIKSVEVPQQKTYDIADCYTIKEVQNKFKISETALQNILKREKVFKKQVGRFVYVPKEVIEEIFS